MATQVKKPAAGARRKPAQKASGGRSARSRAATTAQRNLTGGGSPASALARKALIRTARFVGRRALRAGIHVLRGAVDQSADAGRKAFDAGLSRRLPIQVSIDIAVPVRVVWDEWMTFESICEGIDTIEDVERDGDMLRGVIAGPRTRDWSADILDERELESFAWRSVEGSDCAGLVTFHELAERLTRVEVDLDVLPTGPWQALAFGSHFAHRRAEAELRRFKARLEFINPDVYMDAVAQDGDGRSAGANDDERAGTDDKVDDEDAVDDDAS